MSPRQKVSTCFWFDTNAEEAVKLYVSLFENSEISGISRYGKGARMPEGLALVVNFTLAGREFMALNGGPQFTLSEAASMVVYCETQAEIDRLWAALLEGGGREQQCGWLKDRFGLSWQIVPARVKEMMQDPDPSKGARAFKAIMTMVKFDIAKLEAAFRGE
ncbi:MAG: VOC family protein [Rhodomicrobium sp.]